jgi:hypothetical protein
MRWSVAVVVGIAVAACGSDPPYLAPAESGDAQGNRPQVESGSGKPTSTPEPPYLQLNVEPFLLESMPTEARVGLKASCENIATVWSELTFSPKTVFVADVDGVPDCEVAEGGIGTDAQFSFLPVGCSAADCQNVRAVVRVAEPSQWALLYSCRLVGHGTTSISVRASAISPEGAVAGVISQGARLSWNGPVLLVASGRIDPSNSLNEIVVSMDAGDNVVAAMQNDLHLEGGAAFLATEGGQPDCWANPSIDKPATSIGFIPPDCAGGRCSAIRALVMSWSSTDPIPPGDWLYKCRVTGNGRSSARFSNCLASTPLGDVILATGVASNLVE